MTPAEKAAWRERNLALRRRLEAMLLKPDSIMAFDAENEAKELAAQAIARARVTSEIELMRDDDDDT